MSAASGAGVRTSGSAQPQPGDSAPSSQTTPSPAHATAEILAGAGQAFSGLAQLFAQGRIERDANGQDHLRIPVPDAKKLDALRQALAALAAFG